VTLVWVFDRYQRLFADELMARVSIFAAWEVVSVTLFVLDEMADTSCKHP
jgi:hypothetical protein